MLAVTAIRDEKSGQTIVIVHRPTEDPEKEGFRLIPGETFDLGAMAQEPLAYARNNTEVVVAPYHSTIIPVPVEPQEDATPMSGPRDPYRPAKLDHPGIDPQAETK